MLPPEWTVKKHCLLLEVLFITNRYIQG